MSRIQRSKSTPCVGICSTTYGDLVCRGCKRFAHEITAWNGYEAEQKAQVWRRLNHLRDQVISQVLKVSDVEQLRRYYLAAQIDAAQINGPENPEVLRESGLIYQVLGHLVARSGMVSEAGLVFTEAVDDTAALEVLKRVDAEVYSRSIAHYERNFRQTS